MRSKIDKALQQYRTIKAQVSRVERSREQAKQSFVDHQTALEGVREVIRQVQEKTHSLIASKVSQCIAAVYDDPYEFRLILELKRSQTEARIVFVRDGHELDADDISGGVRDVAAFALRLSCILLHKPAVRRLMVMDEPFKFVERPLLPRVVRMLERLTEELDFQFIMITHIPELMVGQVLNMERQ